MNDTVNIIIVGVGGQGIITAAKVLSEAAMLAGHNVLVAETHGLSQRGGSVIVHVRIGGFVEVPLIPKGRADLMIAMEAIEALRYIDYLGKDGYVVLDRQVIPPPLPGINYIELDDLIRELKASDFKVYDVEASKAAVAYGEPRAANMYLLGYAAGLDAYRGMLSIQHLRHAVLKTMKNADANLKVLERGYMDSTIAASKGYGIIKESN